MARLTGLWRRMHRLGWCARWVIKAALLALTVLLVTYPYPHLLIRNIRRWRNPNALVEPDATQLQPMVAELTELLSPELKPRRALKVVESYVNDKIKYAYDWETWGVLDYLPTVAEVFAQGREDCDGRAVVAASVLRKLGYRADLVSDYTHVWVKTDKGETMGPRKTKSVIATKSGVRILWKNIMNLPRAWIDGIGPFPWERELIVLVVFWFLLLRPGIGHAVPAVGAGLLLMSLLGLRRAGRDLEHPVVWMQWIAIFVLLGATVLMLVQGRRAAGQTTNPSMDMSD